MIFLEQSGPCRDPNWLQDLAPQLSITQERPRQKSKTPTKAMPPSHQLLNVLLLLSKPWASTTKLTKHKTKTTELLPSEEPVRNTLAPSLIAFKTSKKKLLGPLEFLIVFWIGWGLWTLDLKNEMSETLLFWMLFAASARTRMISWNRGCFSLYRPKNKRFPHLDFRP